MGQYHRIYNPKKKEMMAIGGAKLWEQSHSATAAALLLVLCNSNGRGGGDFVASRQDYKSPTVQEQLDQAIITEVQGRWAGDPIVVQGDYADKDDPGFIDPKEFEDYTDISGLVADALLIADDGDGSEVAEIIEQERSSGYGLKPSTRVVKAGAFDRNNSRVMKYVSSSGPVRLALKKRGGK